MKGSRLGRAEAVSAGSAVAAADVLTLLDRLPYAVAVFADDGGRLLSGNQVLREWFGTIRSRKEFLDQFAELVPLPDQDGDNSSVDAFHPQRRCWYRLTWGRLDLIEGGQAQFVSLFDVNEQIQSLNEHKARQDSLLFNARRMSVGEMATTLAHELNQPLAAIINYLSFALNQVQGIPAPPARLADALDLARSQAQHAADVVARMREFVRSREPRIEAQELGGLIASVLRLLQLEAQSHRVRIDIDVNDAIGLVDMDRVMIEQVLLNLVKNAIEALADIDTERRRIRVSARVNADEHAEVRVCDQGRSLSQTEADQAFTPFYSTKSEGMGVGLSICRSIIEYHEGRLFFEPDPIAGNTFVFTLPRHRG